MSSKTKYIVVTGGVLSGLGKGVTGASIGMFFSQEYNVVPIKLDGYLNTDPGTMNPVEHGEVFVLDDGFEVDMDFGHYERFLGNSCTSDQSITMGKVFTNIRDKERSGDYLGQTVQMVPHVTNLIQEKIIDVSKKTKADIVLVEVGGTIGDMENELFVESIRQLERKVGVENVCFIHLTYVPIPYGVKEQKTKPTQQSVSLLNKRGIWPNFVIARCSEKLSANSKKKIALFSNIDPKDVFSAQDVDCIYKVPDVFDKQGLVERVSSKLGLEIKNKNKLEVWNSLLDSNSKKSRNIKIAIAGKYMDLEDSYASVVESISHCGFHHGVEIEIVWFDTENDSLDLLDDVFGIIVPGGFGSRGVEGKISVIKYARENKIPYLGICYGLQLAIVEFCRNVLKIEDATSMELDSKGKKLVVTLLDEQKKVVQMGGTMRLGTYDAKLTEGIIKDLYSKLELIDSKGVVSERHRHRFEVNPKYVSKIEEKGMKVCGKSIERDLVEFIELSKEDHPYFVATQAHPELKSKLEKPAPLFYGLIKAAIERSEK